MNPCQARSPQQRDTWIAHHSQEVIQEMTARESLLVDSPGKTQLRSLHDSYGQLDAGQVAVEIGNTMSVQSACGCFIGKNAVHQSCHAHDAAVAGFESRCGKANVWQRARSGHHGKLFHARVYSSSMRWTDSAIDRPTMQVAADIAHQVRNGPPFWDRLAHRRPRARSFLWRSRVKGRISHFVMLTKLPQVSQRL